MWRLWILTECVEAPFGETINQPAVAAADVENSRAWGECRTDKRIKFLPPPVIGHRRILRVEMLAGASPLVLKNEELTGAPAAGVGARPRHSVGFSIVVGLIGRGRKRLRLSISRRNAAKELDDGFMCLGFSNGGGMSEHVASHRAISGAILVAGVLPLEMAGVESWPSGVPVQVHYTAGDPFRRQDWINELRTDVQAAGASFDLFEYEGEGHLFTDPSQPDEFQSDDAELVWKRVLTFAPLDR